MLLEGVTDNRPWYRFLAQVAYQRGKGWPTVETSCVILAQGDTLAEAVEKAEKTHLQFLPPHNGFSGHTLIFQGVDADETGEEATHIPPPEEHLVVEGKDGPRD